MDKAKVDAIATFKTLQPFFNECDIQYGDRFEDCLKQVAAVYLDLDLSQISIDNTIPLTPSDPNTINDKADDSICTFKDEVKELKLGTIDQPIPKE